MILSKNEKKILSAIEKNGFYKFDKAIPDQKLKALSAETKKALRSKNKYVKKNYLYLAHNFSPHLLNFLDFNPVQKYVDLILGNTCIIHSYNAINLPPKQNNKIQNKIHRDSPRFCRPYLLSVQLLIMLDDFTSQNGATFFYPKSHLFEKKPSKKLFHDKAFQMLGNAGDIVLFDSLMWHRGGINNTKSQRKALTIVYNRPFMKQQIDLTKATKSHIRNKCNKKMRRLLGFNTRVPTNIKEFDLPIEKRLYKPNQG